MPRTAWLYDGAPFADMEAITMEALRLLVALARAWLIPRASLAAKNLALRQQLIVLRRSVRRPKLQDRDRLFWIVLCRFWSDWQSSLHMLRPATLVKWHRQGFRHYWRRKSRCGKPGRPKAEAEIRELIRSGTEAAFDGFNMFELCH